MPYIDATGYHGQSLSEWRGRTEQLMKDVWGDNLVIDTADWTGQLRDQQAALWFELDEALQDCYNSNSIYTAQGTALQRLGASINGLTIKDDSYSYVTLDVVTSTPNTAYPAGLIFSDGTNRWINQTDFTTDALGNASVVCQSEKTGAYLALANTVTTIITPTFGLTSVNNLQDSQLGRVAETDEDYRARLILSNEINAIGTVPSIEANLRELSGVSDVKSIENKTGVDIILQAKYKSPLHSMAFIVRGGNDDDIVDIIGRYGGGGCGTYLYEDIGAGVFVDATGTVIKLWTDNTGNTHSISFIRPAARAINLKIQLQIGTALTTVEQARIKSEYLNVLTSFRTGSLMSAWTVCHKVLNNLGYNWDIVDTLLEHSSAAGVWVNKLALDLLEYPSNLASNVVFEFV